VGRPFCDRTRRHHGRDQRLHRLRSAALQAGHRRLYRTRHHAGGSGHPDPGGSRRDHHRPKDRARRDRDKQVHVLAFARGHPHECREPAEGSDRRRCRAPPHRPLAQRPGGDRFPPLCPRRHRYAAGAGEDPAAGIGQAGRRRSRDHHARLHPPAERPAGDLRPPPASRMRASASTKARSARRRSPAPPTRSIAT